MLEEDFIESELQNGKTPNKKILEEGPKSNDNDNKRERKSTPAIFEGQDSIKPLVSSKVTLLRLESKEFSGAFFEVETPTSPSRRRQITTGSRESPFKRSKASKFPTLLEIDPISSKEVVSQITDPEDKSKSPSSFDRSLSFLSNAATAVLQSHNLKSAKLCTTVGPNTFPSQGRAAKGPSDLLDTNFAEKAEEIAVNTLGANALRSGSRLMDRETDSTADYYTATPAASSLDGETSTLLVQEGFKKEIPGGFRHFLTRLRVAIFGIRPSYQLRLVHTKGATRPRHFVPNLVCNQKYNVLTFLPLVLFQQFRFFFNSFYLCVALSQLIPVLKTGPIFTYLAPLSFVLFVTISKEAYDDYKRFLRDREANGAIYEIITPEGSSKIPASLIQVGHIVQLHANQRVPCDLVFLRTTDKLGTAFLRTDQLDGETDWKLRRPVTATQQMKNGQEILEMDAVVVAEAPRKDIYDFIGKFNLRDRITGQFETAKRLSSSTAFGSASARQMSLTTGADGLSRQVTISIDGPLSCMSGESGNVYAEGLTLENTMWANTVVTSGTILALAVYTGKETRATMNTSRSKSKMGLFDLEVNLLSKILFFMLVLMAIVLMTFKGFAGIWPFYLTRFILLLSSIIPISLRVNLDMAKSYYSYLIMRDGKIPSTVVRTSTLPEELGRVDFLLTDKTGTLTQNDMIFKELHIGKAQFTIDSISDIREVLLSSFTSSIDCLASHKASRRSLHNQESGRILYPTDTGVNTTSTPLEMIGFTCDLSRRKIEIGGMLRQVVIALSLCHNVTPVVDEVSNEVTFQASSPDEVALVRFASHVGIRLVSRDDHKVVIVLPPGVTVEFEILICFPFSSDTKRMGIILRDSQTDRIHFFLKGAESHMLDKLHVRGAHWLQEECANFARRGLRTLVIAHKDLTSSEFATFNKRYTDARAAMSGRSSKMRHVVESIEKGLDLLGLTGVEDRLQVDVPQTLEALGHAGVKVWMLTGDKAETATCIAISAGLKGWQHSVTYLLSDNIKDKTQAEEALESFSMGLRDTLLVVDGNVLSIYLKYLGKLFIESACAAPAVVCCRCSPTQKAEVVKLIRDITGRRTCAIGDGGNDVSMIQAADCGVGIVGNEGKQASLAADFSVQQFHYLRRLLLWHGRNSYQRSAKLAQFVIHRGMIIAVIQAIFSAIFFFIPVAIFQGWLTVGYATYYTMWPVFSLVLDTELPEAVVFMFPELYRTLKSGREMSIKTFFCWIWKSVYQGCVIMIMAILMFEDRFINIVSIAFTSLIMAELLNVASEVTTWHPVMVLAELVAITVYLASMCLLRSYFDILFIITPAFWWKVCVITLSSWLPVHIFKVIRKMVKPPQYTKLAA